MRKKKETHTPRRLFIARKGFLLHALSRAWSVVGECSVRRARHRNEVVSAYLGPQTRRHDGRSHLFPSSLRLVFEPVVVEAAGLHGRGYCESTEMAPECANIETGELPQPPCVTCEPQQYDIRSGKRAHTRRLLGYRN